MNEIQRQEEKIATDKLNQIIQIEQSIDGAETLGLSQDANRYIGIIIVIFIINFVTKRELVYLVKMGEITRFVFKKKPYPCTMVLFNNFIIVNKSKDDKKKIVIDKKKPYKPFTLEFSVKIDGCSITDMADTLDHCTFLLLSFLPFFSIFLFDLFIAIVNAFELRNKATNAGITLCCNSIEDKRVWIKEIRLYIKDYQKMQATKLRNQHCILLFV